MRFARCKAMPIRKHAGPGLQAPVFQSLCDELGRREPALVEGLSNHDLHWLALTELSGLLEAFCKSGEIESIVRAHLVAIRDSAATPPMANNTLLLAETDAHLLSVTLFRARPSGDSKLLGTAHLLLTQSSH